MPHDDGQLDDDGLLVDMLEAACDVERFCRDLTYVEFQNSLLHQRAVIKSIEMIGEAAAHLSDAEQLKHPEIAWHEIIGMRNRTVHGYRDVRLSIVWETARRNIPQLIEQLQRIAPADADAD